MKTKAVGELFAARAWHAHMPHKSGLHKSGHTKAAALNQSQGLHPSSLPFDSVKCDWSNAIDGADLSDRLTY